jgi:hypothetical protein
MNENVVDLMSILKDYFNEVKNNQNISNEDLSVLIENISIDLKDLDRNLR